MGLEFGIKLHTMKIIASLIAFFERTIVDRLYTDIRIISFYVYW